MASTVGGDRVNAGFPILKMEETDDGSLMVWGRATDASLDSDDQIVDPEWSGKAMEEWLTTGANVRVMHSSNLYPAGKGVELATSNDDGHWIKALVVEPTAVRLVKAGVLQAFSVGISSPKIIRDAAAKNGRIAGGKIIEVSLVDRPANASCGFTMVKSADGAVVDADELFGDLTAALAAVEDKVDTAIVEGTTARSIDLAKWQSERESHFMAMPADVKSAEWATWKAEKDSLFEATPEAQERWASRKDTDFVEEPDAAGDKSAETEVEKAGGKKCPKCGKEYHADAKTRKCENCGASLPAAKVDADGDDDCDKSAEVEVEVVETPEVEKSEEAPEPELTYSLKRLHDVTCGVYSDGALLREYASLKSWGDAINVEAVRGYAGDELADIAEALKSADPDMVADARASLHKMFGDMYPNNKGAAVGDIQPGSFRRGYLSAGHYRQNASSGGAARIPDANRVIDAGDFTRGNITAGHERPSPGANKADAVSPPAAAAGTAAWTRNMIQSLHDHFSDRRPEVCAFAPTGSGIPSMHEDAVLTPVTNAVALSGPKNADADLIKAMVDSAMLEKSAQYEDKIAALETQVAELGAQPDPAQAPVRGVVAKLAAQVSPVEKSATEEREPTEAEKVAAWAERFRFDGHPLTRSMAEEVINKASN